MLQLNKYKNTSDQPEFWRVVASLKNDFVRVDTNNSVIQLSKDQKYIKNEQIIDFDIEHNKNENSVEINRKANIITIPIDLLDGKNVNYRKLLKNFPKSIQFLSTDDIIYLALIIFQKNELYFDKAKNDLIIKNSIDKLGFNPFLSTCDWPNLTSKCIPDIDPETLRPYKIVNGKSWHIEARKFIGVNNRFISYYKSIGNFFIKYNKIPTEDEFILFIYKQEVENKNIEIYFKKQGSTDLNKSQYFEKRTRTGVSKLQSTVVQDIRDVIDNFKKNVSLLSINEAINKLTINF